MLSSTSRSLVPLFASLVVALACGGSDPDPAPDGGVLDASTAPDAAPDASSDLPVPRLEDSPCRLEFPGLVEGESVRCATLVVLQDRERPDGLQLRLPVVRVSAVAAPAPDPIVHLLGGPGLSMRAFPDVMREFAYTISEATGREVVIFDQRGTGDSEPFLSCRLSEDFSACARRLLEDGVDVRFFDSVSSAHDVEDLRQVLGASEVNLFGQSYGTLLALEVMRRHPAGVRSVLLESTTATAFDAFLTSSPRSFELAFARLVDECAADSACAARFPDPTADLEAIFASLAPESDEMRGLLTALRALMQNAQGTSWVPLLLSAILADDVETVTALAELSQSFEEERVLRGFSELMFWAVNCYDYAPLYTDEANEGVNGSAAEALRVVFGEDAAGLRALCAQLPSDRLADRARGLVRSAIPTLLVGGTHDDNTPLEIARDVAAELEAARVVEVRGWGHVLLARGNACVREAYARFLADPSDASEPECLGAPTVFATSVD